MLEGLISQMCIAISLNSAGFIMPNTGCTEIVKASLIDMDIKSNVDKTEQLYTTEIRKYAFSEFGENNLKALGTAGFLGNAYKVQKLDIHAPLKPIADNISLTMYDTYYNITVNWKWNLQ